MPTDRPLSSGDSVEVVTSGTVSLSHTCGGCGQSMLYRVDALGQPTWMFCGHHGCAAWLMEVEL